MNPGPKTTSRTTARVTRRGTVQITNLDQLLALAAQANADDTTPDMQVATSPKLTPLKLRYQAIRRGAPRDHPTRTTPPDPSPRQPKRASRK